MYKIKTPCYFIVNPRAGSGKTMCEWLPAERRLVKMGFPFVTAMTDYKKHATVLASEAAAQGYRTIISVGGDGSLHEVFNGVCRWCEENEVSTEEFTLGVVPIGSGNDWIKSLNVPHDVDEVVDLILDSRTKAMDVFKMRCKRADGSQKSCYMANIGGVGFDSHVCQRVNAQKERGRRGKLIYLNALRFTIMTLRAINVSLVADGKEVFSGPCYSIAYGNGKYSGSGMRQVPLAKVDDELLDYTVIPRLPLTRIAKELRRLFDGSLWESPHVVFGQCKELKIIPLDAASEDIIELDGELEGVLPLTIEYIGQKINVITGKNA